MPATKDELRTSLLKFLGPYRSNVSTDTLNDEVGMFVAALMGLPLWAVRQAMVHWLQGRIVDCSPKFVPKPPELRLEADRICETRKVALGSIDMVLAAEPVGEPSEAEREAVLARWFDELRPALVHADVSERNDRDRAEQARANDVVLAREIGDAVPRMTDDMRSKLAEMARERMGARDA